MVATVWGVQIGAEQFGPFPTRVEAEQFGIDKADELGTTDEPQVFSAVVPDQSVRGGVR